MKKIIIAIIAIATTCLNATAQNRPSPISEQEKKKIIEQVNNLLIDEYIFPEVAKKTTNGLIANLKNGVYKSLTDPMEFANNLTMDLRKLSNDNHFIIEFDPEWINESKKTVTKKDSLEFLNRDIAEFKKQNFAFKEIKILDGNIGYLKLIGFCPTSYAGETAVAALSFLQNTDAIIIDLRENGGGSSDMVQLISSYFFSEQPQVFVEYFTRKGNLTERDYNLQYLPGKRMVDKNLYILTSHSTFSAAESFTYIMKNRNRAVIIGETTGGGANPVSRKATNENFTIRIPTSKVIDPITKTDWETVGIKPDFEVPLNEAIQIAQIKAIEKLATSTPDNRQYLWQLDGLKGRLYPAQIAIETLKDYVGKYGPRKIFIEDGSLYFQREGSEKHKLIPIAQDLFLMDGVDNLKIKIQVENGKVIAINRLFDNGDSKVDKKSE